MKLYAGFILLAASLNACNTAKNLTTSAIDIQPLHNYILKPNVAFTDTVTYKFFTTAEDFHSMFGITKVTRSTAKVPDFNTHSVVAIILPPSERVISVIISKAEMAGNSMNIYYNVVDTTSWKTYPHTPKAVAMVSKNINLWQVNFFSKSKGNKTLIIK